MPQQTADKNPSETSQSPTPQGGLSRILLIVMAASTGMAVANLYYAQPLLDIIASSFGISQGSAGNLVTASQIGYACGLVFLVPMGDLLERRRAIFWLALATGLLCVIAALSPVPAVLFAAILLLGISSCFAQFLVPLASELASEGKAGQAVGTVMSGLLLGILLARTVSGAIAEVAGWRSVFAISAALMIADAIALRILLPRVPAHVSISYASLLKSVASLVRTHPLLRHRMLIGAFVFFSFSILWTPLTFFMADTYGLSEGAIGLLGLAGVAGALAAREAGRQSDKGRSRMVSLVTACTLFVSWIVLFAGIRGGVAGFVLVIIGIIVLDFGVQGLHVTCQGLVFGIDGKARGRLNAAYMGTYFVGGAVGTGVASLIWSHWGWAGECILGLIVGALLIALTLPPVQHSVARRQAQVSV